MSRASSFSLKLDPNSKTDLNSFRQWVFAFCIIRFDLEQGQVIEECYPSGTLTQDEELEIAFNSFPDSMSQHNNRSSIHDCMFFFRFPNRGTYQLDNVSFETAQNSSGNQNSVVERSSSRSSPRYIYGYVFNRQRQDERLKRGGEQKSVVILSYSPYSSVFKPLLQILGPLCFDIGKKALEHVASYVSIWPVPVLGKLMELPIGNAAMKVYLPPAHSLLSLGYNSSDEYFSMMAPFPPTNQSVPQGLFHDADIFGIFRGLLLQLWMLWELLIIGEPLLIISPTPPQCCEAVAALVSLVAPLPYSVDFRPYFTIHDPDFARINLLREGDPFPPMVLGVTNLFFLKSLRTIPHVVSVGTPNSSRSNVAPRSSSTGRTIRPDRLNLQQLSLKNFSPSRLLNVVKMRRDGPLCLMTEHKEAIWSTYAATTKPDTAVLNRLVDTGISSRIEESMSVVNNEILRRHFLELTINFLAPFGPYLRATAPSEGTSPFVNPPPLLPFHVDEFLESLSARGPGKFLSKRMRNNWLDLYRRFLKGNNFLPWFQRRRTLAEQEQQRLWRQARVRTDIQQFISKMSELEIVDSFNAIQRHLLGEIQAQRGVYVSREKGLESVDGSVCV
ncbi:polarity axis stabilization protein isoform X2 [Tasmannia lanceolata]|uniref:polarity axis stabilization protein isoform X2 n=1 Tax=Tasmannia lanceolata TaxID=3420 RepID=UPI004063E423